VHIYIYIYLYTYLIYAYIFIYISKYACLIVKSSQVMSSQVKPCQYGLRATSGIAHFMSTGGGVDGTKTNVLSRSYTDYYKSGLPSRQVKSVRTEADTEATSNAPHRYIIESRYITGTSPLLTIMSVSITRSFRQATGILLEAMQKRHSD